MDIHQHHQRALCPRLTHGSLDLQRNDRLGRRRSHQRFEHRREILRPIWPYTNTDSYSYPYGDADTYAQCYRHSNGNGDGYTDRDGDYNSNPYFDTETFTNAETGANA